MAEGWLRTLGGDAFVAQSAGIEAHGKNPRAIAVMAEADIDISGQESTIVSDGMIGSANVVVTVCGHADEQCPVLPPSVQKIHWPLSDPAKAKAAGIVDEVSDDPMDDARAWVESQPSFWAVVVAPWVLVQPISND